MEYGERRARPLPSCLYLFSKTCTTVQKDVKTSLIALSFTVSHPSQASCSQALKPAAVSTLWWIGPYKARPLNFGGRHMELFLLLSSHFSPKKEGFVNNKNVTGLDCNLGILEHG